MRLEIAWRTDERGMLLGAPMHDGTLVEFVMAKERLAFGIRALSGEFITVELAGLGQFTVRELWDFPIVSEFWVWKVGLVPESWNIPDGPWNVLLASRMRNSDARREATKIAETRPDSFLVQLTCSYGGEAAAICDRIRVLENGPDMTGLELA
jgi:hypothetical protein